MDRTQEMCEYPCGGGLFAKSKDRNKEEDNGHNQNFTNRPDEGQTTRQGSKHGNSNHRIRGSECTRTLKLARLRIDWMFKLAIYCVVCKQRLCDRQ